ncbi:lipocalin-like domain-containing protein [Rhodobacteraceae bacterium DSL-40]|uniref:lipocalin-like domain-containing protein n=1 Tax=Amaricoccus sp. B4 TaxID=3368557 RepID=UPI000DABB310
MSARIWLAALALLAATPAAPQGYAGLATDAEGYAAVTAPARLAFPRDHGPHPAFRIEWWYLTATLEDAEGREWGAQWTLFRQSLAPGPDPGGWESTQVWLAHAAVTGADTHRTAETYARGGIGQAGVTLGPFRAWIDDWEMAAAPAPGDALADITVTAQGADFGYSLHAVTEAPPVPQGEDGFSVKSDVGQASYYYSQPFYRVAGTLEIDGRRIPVTGRGWLDREWSSQPLAAGQEGWDWFSLALDSGARVMLYAMRNADGSAHVSGTWIDAESRPHPLAPGDISMRPVGYSQVAGREIPTAWHLEVPRFELAVDTEPLNAHSWMDTSFAYWEGPIRLSGSHAGRGYLEMTGYD